MNHCSILVIGSIIPLLLSGCTTSYSWFGTTPILPTKEYKRLAAAYSNHDAIIRRVLVTTNSSGTEVGRSESDKALERNKVLDDEILLADYKYNKFKTGVHIRDAGFNSGADLVSIGLSGAATLVGGPSGQILSGADTAVKAAQGKVSERWLANKTIPVLITRMDADRADVLSEITSNMTQVYKEFPIETGLKLVQRYNDSGNIVNALIKLQTDASNAQKTNEDKLTKARSQENKF